MTRVHHALFGDAGGRHVLLAASVKRDSVIEAIRARSDLAPDRPAHVEWTPYVTGLRVQDVYVVMRTVPDSEASRPGMVLTHAAFAPLVEVVQLDDIGRLVAALPVTPVRLPALSPSSLPETAPGGRLPPAVHADLIDAVMAAAPAGRIGWIGHNGFDVAVREVWRIMREEERADFSFGFAFNPRSTPADSSRGVSLIRTARRLRDRWSGEPIVDPDYPSGTPSPVAAALLGHPGGEEISALLGTLGQPALSIGQYETLSVAASYFAMIQQDAAPLAAVRTLTHLIGQLAPDPGRGSEFKAQLTARLGSDTRTGEDLLGLRNFDPAPYRDGHDVFSSAAQNWAHTALIGPVGRTHDPVVVLSAVTAEKASAWGKAVVDTLRAKLGSWREEYAEALWIWWREAEAIIEPTLRWAQPPSRAERDLVAHAPNDIPNSAAVQRQSGEQGFLVLFVHVLSARNPRCVFASLAELDPSGEKKEAWEHAASRLGPSKTATAAAEADPIPDVLLQIAGRTAASNPNVFQNLDASHKGWRKVWASAVENGMGVFAGIKSAVRQRDALLKVENQDEATHTLLIAISDTDAADLLDHPHRSQIWDRLPGDVRDAYLRTTAASWTERLKSGQNVDWTLEVPLARTVFAPQSNALMFDPAQPGSIALAVAAFGRTPLLDERAFIGWIGDAVARGPRLSRSDAMLVGSLVARQVWKDAARTVFRTAERRRADFWGAVGEFTELLGPFDRAKFALRGGSLAVSKDEWWAMFEEAAADLLAIASQLEYVWESAGGQLGDLPSTGTGKQRVHYALRLVKDGNRVTADRLIGALLHEFESNDRLDLIKKIGYKVGILSRVP